MRAITQVQIPGSNYQDGRAAKVDQITFHHIVGDAPAALARFKNVGEQVSSTYVIGSNGQIYQCVAEGNTPYTDANFASNSRAITIEHAGGIAGVPYTEAMYAASIELCAWIRSRYNITRFMRHRDVSSVPTACPGALDVERIVAASAKELDDMVKPTEAQVYGAFRQFLGKEPRDPAEVQFYLDRDIRVLYENVLFAGLQPKEDEIRKAFSDLSPRGTVPSADQITYYANHPRDFLYRDLGYYETLKAYNDLKANPPAGGTGGSYTAADRATATETNTLVKQIWAKITSVFK